jgi:phage terminase large subunit-like protein
MESKRARLSKETKTRPGRIDAAVAAVMAVRRAAELAGASRPDIYI